MKKYVRNKKQEINNNTQIIIVEKTKNHVSKSKKIKNKGKNYYNKRKNY